MKCDLCGRKGVTLVTCYKCGKFFCPHTYQDRRENCAAVHCDYTGHIGLTSACVIPPVREKHIAEGLRAFADKIESGEEL